MVFRLTRSDFYNAKGFAEQISVFCTCRPTALPNTDLRVTTRHNSRETGVGLTKEEKNRTTGVIYIYRLFRRGVEQRRFPPIMGIVRQLWLTDRLFFTGFDRHFTISTRVNYQTHFRATGAGFGATKFTMTRVFIFRFFRHLLSLFSRLALTVTIARFRTRLFFLNYAICQIQRINYFVLRVYGNTVSFVPRLVAPYFRGAARIHRLNFVRVLFTQLLLV